MNNRSNVLLIATIASQVRQKEPFNQEHSNDAYAHLSMLCDELNINLYITHFANTINDSEVLSWIFKNGEWKMVELAASEITSSYADLPQNFPESNELRNILIKNEVIFFNDLDMSDCLTDKILTYQLLPNFVPPTFDTSVPDISNSLRTASNHPDLRTDKLILKPRYGERGKGIEVINFADLESDYVAKKEGFIVQPIMESDLGIPELGIYGRHDLRILIYNGEIKDFFVRVAPANTFICNQSRGAEFFYFNVGELPKRFREVAYEIDNAFNQYVPRYYTIDIGVGRSGKIWVYELNTMPGIVWRKDFSDKMICIQMHKNIVAAIKSTTIKSGVMS